VIPVFNEEKKIGKVLREVRKELPDCEVLVVDDGSTDRTWEIARDLGVRVLRHGKNLGKGEALRTGIKNARGDLILVIDGDGQFSVKDGKKLLKFLKDADLAIGKRDFGKMPLRHRLGNFLWRFFFNILFGTRFDDTNCGLFAFKRNVSEKLRVHGGYIVENSVLASAVESGLKIVQVPVRVRYGKPSGTLRGLRMVLGVLVFIILEGIRFRFRSIRAS